MPDFYTFDLAYYYAWRTMVFWAMITIGSISGLVALGSYSYKPRNNTFLLALLISLIIIFLYSFWPVNWEYGGDRRGYATGFIQMQEGLDYKEREIGFIYLSLLLSKIVTPQTYFVILEIIYIGGYLYAANKLTKGNCVWLMAAFIVSFGFVGYGVNTLRSGLGYAFLAIALCQYPSRVKMIVWIVIAYLFHKSMILPGLMMIIATFWNNTRLIYYLWFLAIPISFVAGDLFQTMFADMIQDSRTSYLTDDFDKGYDKGFRIDFIIYSLVPVIIGWYYLFRKNVQSKIYRFIYNTYLLANIFWIMVIRAEYTDRFAYLSWWLIPFILTYPLLTQKMNLRENKWLGCILLGETAFYYIM